MVECFMWKLAIAKICFRCRSKDYLFDLIRKNCKQNLLKTATKTNFAMVFYWQEWIFIIFILAVSMVLSFATIVSKFLYVSRYVFTTPFANSILSGNRGQRPWFWIFRTEYCTLQLLRQFLLLRALIELQFDKDLRAHFLKEYRYHSHPLQKTSPATKYK